MADSALKESDTIRILIATDSHVGYGERDPIRKDDSWRSFDEAMKIAKERDVDMVLLAGDLFHDNKPSRTAMYQVMRSLRMNCLGNKTCELEMLSDQTEAFEGVFNHVNYEDPDINVAIPVFSIHGNHDDPTGEGHLASLDILQIVGLVNYYGRTHESDNIEIKPLLFQKGRTKLALYGMSNVRDERLFRTFRDGKVKFFRPSTQTSDWFNIMSVHQNRHAYSETGYLPETFIPNYMDLVVWGHEHECLINPRQNPETGFYVMQPGSSVATSLVPGEAVPKHVAIVSVTGKDFHTEPIQLKTVRPFVMKEIILAEDPVTKKLAKQDNHRAKLTRRLEEIVEELIGQAKSEWLAAQEEPQSGEELEPPLPLIRLRVEYSAPDGGQFDCENPQRFSNRFIGKVANVNDVVQFHRKKASATRKAHDGTEMPAESVMAQLSIDSVKVEKLVREFLTAQSLTILPQNSFGDAVAQFVDKDDKHAMEMFVSESLKTQVQHLLELDNDEPDLQEELEANKSRLEDLFRTGRLKKTKRAKLKPKPDGWDTDIDGNWSDEPGAMAYSDIDASDDEEHGAPARNGRSAAASARGRGRDGRSAAGTTSTRKEAVSTKKALHSAPAAGRGRKRAFVEVEAEEEEEEKEEEEARDEDVVMQDDIEDEEGEDDSQLFVQDTPPTRSTRAPAPKTPANKSRGGGTQAKLTQSTLLKSTLRKKVPTAGPASQASALSGTSSGIGTGIGAGRGLSGGVSRARAMVIDDDEDDDDDMAFAPAPVRSSTRRR